MKEFEEIHQQAKTALSKGNFSFGNWFYQDSKLDQLEAQNSDNDTFRLETEEDIGYKMKNDWNKKPYYQEHDSKNVRKQWNKKPAFQQEPDQFDDDNDDGIKALDYLKYRKLEARRRYRKFRRRI